MVTLSLAIEELHHAKSPYPVSPGPSRRGSLLRVSTLMVSLVLEGRLQESCRGIALNARS
jgi:hypothetical protein